VNPKSGVISGGAKIMKRYVNGVQTNEEEIIKAKENVGGILTDVAPTVLELLELGQPEEMTGKSLVASIVKFASSEKNI
jgi:hypothetical protein